LIIQEILAGFMLSIAELEGLRQNVKRFFLSHRKPISKKGWEWFFVARYAALALTFWILLEMFKPHIFPFVLSFLFSNIVLRYYKIVSLLEKKHA
jgi:hypothetical protein